MTPLPGGGAAASGAPASSMIVSLLLIAAVLMLRNRRARPLRIERLWLRPAISIAFALVFLFSYPPPLSAVSVAVVLLGLAVGAAVGWQRGRFMRIEVDPATHAMTARMSQLGMVLVLAFFAARYLLRGAFLGPVPAASLTDALMLSAAAMMLAQQTEVSLRARRLLQEARARGGPAAPNAL
jgi:p-aminobenzoyl-glutamate transporter AbgT